MSGRVNGELFRVRSEDLLFSSVPFLCCGGRLRMNLVGRELPDLRLVSVYSLGSTLVVTGRPGRI